MTNSVIREKTGRSSEFHDLLQLVRTIVVPVNTDTISFTGLDGDKDGFYLLRAKIISGSALGDNILLRPQGSDAFMSSTNMIATAGSVTCSRQAVEAIVGALYIVNGLSLLDIEFFASKADGITRGGFARCSRAVGVADILYHSTIGYADNVTKITRLDLFADQGTGAGFQAGSVVSLFKSPG